MNITLDNYEAYLLDHMEGNLSEGETEQLKAYVAAQGLDWAELTEPLPHLEAPETVYEKKESLKKRTAVVPMYVKIASAAAAAGLLLTVTLWPEKSMPKVEPIAELKPIEAIQINLPTERPILAKRPVQMVEPNVVAKEKLPVEVEKVVMEKTEMPLVAELPKIKANSARIEMNYPSFEEPDFDHLAYRLNTAMTLAQFDANPFEEIAEEENVSLIGRGLLWLTKGRHSSFASLINSGLSHAKEETTEAATNFAMAAYQRADEQFTETKERWEEKRGE